MILRCVCWSVFLCLALSPAVRGQVEVTEQGYQNVLISFSPNVPSDKGQELLQSVQDLLEKTSSVLQTAIGIRIASATFLLPPSWSTEKFANINISAARIERRPDINVDATEQSPFGKKAVALQHGGCGVPGHQITLPLDFLSSSEGYPKGKLLAREWLKYRYGVFEENGFKHDDIYPNIYRISGRSEITVTECTESDVTYAFKYSSDDYCDSNTDSNILDLCIPTPDKESAANVTSSLMYYHQDLPNMEHICGKDGRRHLSTVKSKQNILCNGKSIWDVVKLSKDFDISQQEPAQKSIQFSYVQESKPAFVVLLENSDNLHEKQEQIRFALRRFYYDVPPKSKLAIYTFNKDVVGPLVSGELPTLEDRPNLDTIADFTYSQKDICTSCALEKARQSLLLNSPAERGSVLLITASSLDKVPALDEKLKNSGICLDVLRFHDEKDPVDKSYEALKDSFSCFSYRPASFSLDKTEMLSSLYSFLTNPVPKPNDGFEIKTWTMEMSGKDFVTVPHDETASFYSLWLDKVFSSSSSIQCKAGETDVTLKPGTKGTDISEFTFDPVDTDVDITCSLSSPKLPAILTQVQMTTKKGHYFDFDVWIHDMSTEKEQLPIKIYAKLFYGGYPVKGANVTTIVTSDKNPAVIVTMLDNGRGEPDVTKDDGVYSGVFVDFFTAGEYKIVVKVEYQEIFTKIGKEYDMLTPDTCCGSKVTSKDFDVPAFDLEKAILYTAKKKRPDGGYRPFRIVDLGMVKSGGMIVLNWHAPLGEKIERYDLKMFHSREDVIESFDTKGEELNSSAIMSGNGDRGLDAYILNYDDLKNGTAYYVALRSWSRFNKSSEISNILEFFLPKDFPTTTSSTPPPSTTPKDTTGDKPPGQTSGKKTTEIVVGVVAGIVVLCILGFLAYYFFVQKPKRREEARVRQGVENGQRTTRQ